MVKKFGPNSIHGYLANDPVYRAELIWSYAICKSNIPI